MRAVEHSFVDLQGIYVTACMEHVGTEEAACAAAFEVCEHAGDALLEGSQGAISSSVPDTFQQSLDVKAPAAEDWQVNSHLKATI